MILYRVLSFYFTRSRAGAKCTKQRAEKPWLGGDVTEVAFRLGHLVVVQRYVENVLAGGNKAVEAGSDHFPKLHIFTDTMSVIESVAGQKFVG